MMIRFDSFEYSIHILVGDSLNAMAYVILQTVEAGGLVQTPVWFAIAVGDGRIRWIDEAPG